MNQKEFFNSMAEKWDNICNHDQKKINEILDLSNILQGAKILDVGTGTGVMIPFLISKIGNTGKVTAVDAANKMIEIARSKYNYANVNFIIGNVFTLNLPVEYFDIVMCYSVFPHFQDKRAAIEKFRRFLKPGGKIVICHSESRNEINNMHKNASQFVSKDYLPDTNTIKRYFLDYSFDTVAEVDNKKIFVLIGQKNTP